MLIYMSDCPQCEAHRIMMIDPGSLSERDNLEDLLLYCHHCDAYEEPHMDFEAPGCPACDGDGVIRPMPWCDYENRWWFAVCDSCGCQWPAPTMEEAAEIWRAPRPIEQGCESILQRVLPQLALLRGEQAEAVEWGILEPVELHRLNLLIQDIEDFTGEEAPHAAGEIG